MNTQRQSLLLLSGLAAALLLGGCDLPSNATAASTAAAKKSTTATPAATTTTTPAAAPAAARPAAEETARSAVDGVGSGFLWKPVSESNGKLAVIFPREYTGKIARTSVHSGFPVSDANRIDDGTFSTTGNGNRMTWRFPKSGGAYPANCYATAYMKDGSSISYYIPTPGSRLD